MPVFQASLAAKWFLTFPRGLCSDFTPSAETVTTAGVLGKKIDWQAVNEAKVLEPAEMGLILDFDGHKEEEQKDILDDVRHTQCISRAASLS